MNLRNIHSMNLPKAVLYAVAITLLLCVMASCKEDNTSMKPVVEKTLSASDPAPFGWATQNGGTTGGAGGSTVVVTTSSQLSSALAAAGKSIIYVQGTITGYVNFKVSSNKTIFGLPGSVIQGYLSLNGVSNVIIRNLNIRGQSCPDYNTCKDGKDGVHMDGGTHNVWLDHLDVADGQDGNCDITDASDFITISWTKFSYTYAKEHAFSNLIGNVDNNTADIGKLNVTMHHNWWADNIQERQPRLRYGKIQVANNLFTSTIASYAVGAGMSGNVRVEGNIFKSSTTTPIETTFNGTTNYTAILGINNVGPSGANQTHGTAFTPPYSLTIDATTNLETTLRQSAGATLPDPR